MSPIHVFCNILDRISSLVNVNEKFCNKNLFLDLFIVVLIVSQVLTACRICIKVVVLNKMHWERVGGVGHAKRIGPTKILTAYFQVCVATKISRS